MEFSCGLDVAQSLLVYASATLLIWVSIQDPILAGEVHLIRRVINPGSTLLLLDMPSTFLAPLLQSKPLLQSILLFRVVGSRGFIPASV